MTAAPQPTRSMEQIKTDLADHGFAMFEDALDPDTTVAVRDRMLEQAAVEKKIGYGNNNSAVEPDDDVNQWVAFLPNKGAVCRALINNRPCIDTVRHILGDDAILSEFSAHITWPGNKEMGLHIDQWFMPQAVMPGEDYTRPSDVSRLNQFWGGPEQADHPINPPVVCNVMFAITDFTIENGATRLVSGSHRSGHHPVPDTDYDVTYAEIPAGSFVTWEGRTWHAASLNTGNSPRVGITTYWTAPFIRQLLNFPYGLRPEVAAELSEHERALMGFKIWNTYGATDDFGAQWARPGPETMGILKD